MSKKHIVIIENDRSILELIEIILIDGGFDVTGITDEKELLQLTVYADLFLLDNWLDGRTGHDICIDLKKNPLTSSIPVILMSASNDVEEIAEKCNADSYLVKPFDIDYLLEHIKQFI